jgi:hypothetical protein
MGSSIAAVTVTVTGKDGQPGHGAVPRAGRQWQCLPVSLTQSGCTVPGCTVQTVLSL